MHCAILPECIINLFLFRLVFVWILDGMWRASFIIGRLTVAIRKKKERHHHHNCHRHHRHLFSQLLCHHPQISGFNGTHCRYVTGTGFSYLLWLQWPTPKVTMELIFVSSVAISPTLQLNCKNRCISVANKISFCCPSFSSIFASYRVESGETMLTLVRLDFYGAKFIFFRLSIFDYDHRLHTHTQSMAFYPKCRNTSR